MNLQFDYASANGHTTVLDWWLNSGLLLEYTSDAFERDEANGRTNVVNWWLISGLKIKRSEIQELLNELDRIQNSWILPEAVFYLGSVYCVFVWAMCMQQINYKKIHN